MSASTHLHGVHRTDTPTVHRPAPPRGLVLPALVLLGLAVGAVVGALTLVLQSHADGASQSLVNAISPWLAPAFAVGAFARRPWHAAFTGVLVCLAELAAYDMTAIHRGYLLNMHVTLFWACGGVIGGALFGWAGHAWWRPAEWMRGLGVALMSGTFITEAGNYLFGLHYQPSAHLFAAIGAALFLVLGLRDRQHAPAACWLLAVLPLGMFGEVLANTIVAHVN